MTDAPQPRLCHVPCLDSRGLHRMAYWEWGDPANGRVLVCVHGLSRQGRDFDALAADLAREYRVICPDVVGRGLIVHRDPDDYKTQPTGNAGPRLACAVITKT